MKPQSRATLVVAVFAAVPAVVLGVIALLAAGPVAGVVVLVVVGGALAAWARFAGDRRVLAAVGGRDADPVSDARLWNLAEGLSISAGLRQPRLRVIDSPGLNAMAAGTRADRAHRRCHFGAAGRARSHRAGGGPGRGADPDPAPRDAAGDRGGRPPSESAGSSPCAPTRDAEADQAAVALTRYPPALASALEKVEAKGADVAGQPASLAHLWLADPRPGAAARPGPADHSRTDRGAARAVTASVTSGIRAPIPTRLARWARLGLLLAGGGPACAACGSQPRGRDPPAAAPTTSAPTRATTCRRRPPPDRPHRSPPSPACSSPTPRSCTPRPWWSRSTTSTPPAPRPASTRPTWCTKNWSRVA